MTFKILYLSAKGQEEPSTQKRGTRPGLLHRIIPRTSSTPRIERISDGPVKGMTINPSEGSI